MIRDPFWRLVVTWVLILFTHCAFDCKADAVSLHHVPGFQSRQACVEAGTAASALGTRGYPVKHVCVPVSEKQPLK
jgi:hypothetical protein